MSQGIPVLGDLDLAQLSDDLVVQEVDAQQVLENLETTHFEDEDVLKIFGNLVTTPDSQVVPISSSSVSGPAIIHTQGPSSSSSSTTPSAIQELEMAFGSGNPNQVGFQTAGPRVADPIKRALEEAVRNAERDKANEINEQIRKQIRKIRKMKVMKVHDRNIEKAKADLSEYTKTTNK